MQQGYKFRIYPTTDQQRTLRQWIGCQRFIYNAKVGEDRYYRSFAHKSLQHTGEYAPIDQQFARFKDDELTPWLSEVPSQILRNGAYRWKQAYARHFQRLAGRPTINRGHGPQGVWLTEELFSITPVTDEATDEVLGHRLILGTGKFPVGEIRVKAHRKHGLPKSITVSVDAVHWHVSFNVDDGVAEHDERDVAAWLAQFSLSELRERSVGLDRGVAIPLCASNGELFKLQPIQQARIAKKQRAKVRWQRTLARRVKGSSNSGKAKRKIAACARYEKQVRHDSAHQTSHSIVADPKISLIVFEALGVRQMTKRAKPKLNAQGGWDKNNAAAKSGLNCSILSSSWGKIHTFTKYKALRAHKGVIEVPAHYSSQECAACGFTHSDNRLSHSRFVCQRCAHADNADHNASVVIRDRGVRMIQKGADAPKEKKRVSVKRRSPKVGAGCSDPRRVATPAPKLVEIRVRRGSGNRTSHRSAKQETPATSRRL